MHRQYQDLADRIRDYLASWIRIRRSGTVTAPRSRIWSRKKYLQIRNTVLTSVQYSGYRTADPDSQGPVLIQQNYRTELLRALQ